MDILNTSISAMYIFKEEVFSVFKINIIQYYKFILATAENSVYKKQAGWQYTQT